MKKALSILIVLGLMLGIACAEGIDWADLTDEEIAAILEAGQAELDSRSAAEAAEAADGSTGSDAGPAEYVPLEKGSKGDEVKALQQRLVDLYWLDGSVDGDYGNKTKDAVERFQEEAGLTVTGVADGETQARLFSGDAPEASMSVGCSSVVIGNHGETLWFVNGQEFKLTGSQTKTLKTPWGTYKFNALGEYEQID